jgi:hypothetical protein
MKINIIKKHIIKKHIISSILSVVLLAIPVVAAEVHNNKENIYFDYANVNLSSSSAGLRASTSYKTPKNSPPPSPTKKSPFKAAPLSERSPAQVGSPHGSPTKGSPTKKSVRTSPTKAGVDSIAGVGSTVDVKRLQSDFCKKMFSEGIVERALEMTRQQIQPLVTPAQNYLCALPTPETSRRIDSTFKDASKQVLSTNFDVTLPNLLGARSDATVLNCSVTAWPEDKYYHMSLDLKKHKGHPVDEDKLKFILSKVEFPFREIGVLGRFIVIRLNDPQVKLDCGVSEEEMAFLKKFLEYADQPMMHISLVNVNAEKKEMACVNMGNNKVEIPLSHKFLESEIERAEHKGNHIHISGITKSLSHAFFWLLHLGSEGVRKYLSGIHTVVGSEDDLYDFVDNRAASCLNNVSAISEIGQHYIRHDYGIDYDFTDKIGIKINDKERYPLNKQLVVELLSNIFLNNQDDVMSSSEEFGQFRNFFKFCLGQTKLRVSRKQNEIKSGVVDVSTIGDSLMGLFGATEEELPEDVKARYLRENESDSALINDIEEKLALQLIQLRFFGFEYDAEYFIRFMEQYKPLIQLIHEHEKTKGILSDETLDKVQNASMKLSRDHFISKTFTFQEGFNFRASLSSLPIFICISESIGNDLKTNISEAMKKIINDNQDKIANGVLETISFTHSKIPNAPFWRKYIRELQGCFNNNAQPMMFQFSGLSHQPIEDLTIENEAL